MNIKIKKKLIDLFRVDKELVIVFLLVVITGIIFFIVSNQRAFLNFFYLPVLVGAYLFGKRYATHSAIFSIILISVIAYFYPETFILSGNIHVLDVEALTINTSSLTAVGNDYSFAKIFSRQIEAKGKPGDVLIGISTSGNSENVIEAIKIAKNMNLKTIGLTGNNKGNLICKLADYCICVPSNSTPRIQEIHILIGHILCELIEKQIFQN